MIWPGLAAEAMSLATLWTGRLAPLIPSCSVSVWAGSEARRGEGRASLPKGPPDLRGQAWFGTVSITFFLFLCFLASGLPGDQDLSITHSLEVMEEVKERDLPC